MEAEILNDRFLGRMTKLRPLISKDSSDSVIL